MRLFARMRNLLRGQLARWIGGKPTLSEPRFDAPAS